MWCPVEQLHTALQAVAGLLANAQTLHAGQIVAAWSEERNTCDPETPRELARQGGFGRLAYWRARDA